MSTEGSEKERKFWNVDPAIYQRRVTRRNLLTRPLHFLKSVAVYTTWGLVFAYPLVLTYLGVAYGWMGFWGGFLGSVLVIGLVIAKAGLNRNFDAWSSSFSRQLLGLVLGFIIAGGFYLGIFILRVWLLPVVLGILLAAFAYRLIK